MENAKGRKKGKGEGGKEGEAEKSFLNSSSKIFLVGWKWISKTTQKFIFYNVLEL